MAFRHIGRSILNKSDEVVYRVATYLVPVIGGNARNQHLDLGKLVKMQRFQRFEYAVLVDRFDSRGHGFSRDYSSAYRPQQAELYD